MVVTRDSEDDRTHFASFDYRQNQGLLLILYHNSTKQVMSKK